MSIKFTFYKQAESKDCGSTCLRMVAKWYGEDISITEIRALSETTREGVICCILLPVPMD